MPKKEGKLTKKKRRLKDRIRERQIRLQRTLEAHRLEIEKVQAEKRDKKRRFNIITLATCIFLVTITLFICITWQYTKPPSLAPQNQNESQQTPQSPSNAIYIWPNSVEPKTVPITKVKDNYYRLTANVTLPIIVLRDNIVIDGAGYFLKGDGTIGSRGIDISYRRNVTVVNFKIEGFDYGVFLNSTTNAVISHNEFANNYCGIWLTFSSQNNITLNNISKNKMYGIWLKNAKNNLIYKNTFTCHQNYTIYLGYSSFNIIQANNFSENTYAIFMFSSSNNTIAQNDIVNNFEGICLLQSTQNNVHENKIRKNNIGMDFDNSSNNTISRNNFIDNTRAVGIVNSINSWNDSSKNGNYWSDYNGADTNKDGIGDTPYVIDENNKDERPRITPYS